MGTSESPRLAGAVMARRLAMAVGLALGSLLLSLWFLAVPARAELPDGVVYDQRIADMMGQITTETLTYDLAGFTGERSVIVSGVPYTIATRHSYQTEAISVATRYAYEQLAATGLSVTFHNYIYAGYALRNVVAEKPGRGDSDEIYLITAHMDSMPSGSVSPGADDNGSGSVAVIAAARLLAPRTFFYTLRFVLFTGEEQWLRGSDAYAQHCFDQGENIAGVINLDMIAYDSDADPIVDLHYDSGVPASLALTAIFSDVVDAYGLDLQPELATWGIRRSDQWSFLTLGYPGMLAIEDDDDFTPYYHTTGDVLSTLNVDYYAECTRAGIATIAHLGRLIVESGITGTVRAQGSDEPLAADVQMRTSTYHYTFTTATDPTGLYSLSLPADVYTLMVLPAQPYYSVVLTDVSVVSGSVTVRNVCLEPWHRWLFPIVMRDA